MIDRLIDRSIDRLIEWLIDWFNFELPEPSSMSATVPLSDSDVKSNSEDPGLRKGNRTIMLICEGTLLIY